MPSMDNELRGQESRLIRVEVAYARPDEQVIIPLELEQGATVADAIRQSKIGDRYPEINLDSNKVGIFGKLARLDSVLKAKDRVEIYRPLIADPKEMRKKRAGQKA